MPRTSAPANREILEAALHGLETQRQKLEEQISQVRSLLGRRAGRPAKTAESSSSAGRATGSPRKRRTLSAEARKRIAAAQKKRWAAFRKSNA